MSSRPLVLIQARMGSSRLPGKVLLRAGESSLLEHLIHRVRRSRFQPEIVLCTTREGYDDSLELAARDLGIACERGASDDVLARFEQALTHRHASTVVRLTADCPLLDPRELDRVLEEFSVRLGTDYEVDYASNQAGEVRRIPRGQDVEVMRREALLCAAREATNAGDREHVTPYLYRTPNRFRTLITHRPGPDGSMYRLTVDTASDFEVVRAVVDALGPDASLDAILEWLGAHPDVVGRNRAGIQKTTEGEATLRARRIAGRTLIARADGGARIGSGHLTRVEALLDAWTESGGRSILFGAGVGAGQAQRLAQAGIEVRLPGSGEAAETVALAHEVSAAAVILDGYAFDNDYHGAIARELPLAVIDDLMASGPVAPLLINQNAGADAASYGETTTRLLLGADYILLRRGLRSAVERVPTTASADSMQAVGIAFGGLDPLSLTLPTARALLGHLANQEVCAVMGSGACASQLRALEELSQRDPRLVVLQDVVAVEEQWCRFDVLIAAAGTTAYEALALGVPCVLLPTADNQRVVSAGVANAGAAIVLTEPDPEQAASRAAELLADARARDELSRRGRRLVDARGVWRVIDALLDIVDRKESRG